MLLAMAERFARVPISAAAAKLGARALRVLIAIAAHADHQGQAFPSLARISETTGFDRRGLHREIGSLVTARLLGVERRHDAAGDCASNHASEIWAGRAEPISIMRVRRNANNCALVISCAIQTSFCCTNWKPAIGRPNCSRDLA